MAEPHVPPARVEPQDVTFRFLLFGAASVLGLVLVCAFLAMLLYPSAVQDKRLTSPLPVYPAPRLQSDPHHDLMQFQAAEMSRLTSTGWVDRDQGIVHIPIDDAMQRIARQGIPDWPAQAGGKP
jgi:hypothetical protein